MSLEETGFKAKPVEYLGEFTYEVKNDANKKITMVTVQLKFFSSYL